MIPLPHVVDTGSGRPVVFLHGWAVNADFFAPQHVLAASGLRVIAPDLPGHGRNQSPGVPLSIADLSHAFTGLLAARALERALVVGWSMGAMVALDHIARAGTARIAGLVMVDMTAKVANDSGWALGLSGGAGADDMIRAAARMETGWAKYAERITALMFAADRPADDPIRRRAALAVAANDGVTMASLWRALALADHRETIKALDIPVLAIGGAASQLYSRDVPAWIAANARRGRAAMIAGAGHAPQLEAPEAFNAAIADFARALD